MADIRVTTQKLRETSTELQAKKDDIARRLDELSELELCGKVLQRRVFMGRSLKHTVIAKVF